MPIMKKLLFTIFIAICLILPLTSHAITTYNCNGLTGGTARDLDYLSVFDLNNSNRAIVLTGTIKYHFKYDSTATNVENVATHPFKVRPDDYSSAGVWIEQELATSSVDAAIIAASAVGTSEIADGTVATADLATGAVTPIKVNIPGLVVRAKFTWKDADEIYIQAFIYDHQGTTEQLVYSSSSFAYTFTNLGTSDWSYLYLDDSAIVTAGTNLISSVQFTDSTTESAWSESKHGQYNGDDRCVFVVFTDASDHILEFFHEGNLVTFADRIADMAANDIDNAWADVTLTLPIFCRNAEVSFYGNAAGAAPAVLGYWRTDGQTGANGHHILTVANASSRYSMNTINVHCSASQIIEVKYSAAGDQTIEVNTDGWYFLTGM